MLRYGLLALGIPFLLYFYIVATGYDGKHYLRGDCPYYYVTALSLYLDGDLDLSNQIKGDFGVHNGSVSLSKDGKLVPKHPIVMPIFALPLLIAFGTKGALIFNLLQMAVLLFLTFVMARRYVSDAFAAIAVILTGTITFLPHYVWNFSGDLFAAVLLVAALVALPDTPDVRHWKMRLFAAGFLFALTVVSKFALLVFLPGILLICPPPKVKNLALVCAGAVLPFLAFSIYNYELFGSPMTTSYHRIAMLHEGKLEPYSQEVDFNLPFLEGLYQQMFHRQKGLFYTSALTLVSLLGLPLLARRNKWMAIYIPASSLLLYLFFCRYRLWDQTHYGNRFLIPIVILAAVPLASLLETLVQKVRNRFQEPAHAL